MEHCIAAELLGKRVTVHLVGVGGNGAQMAACLARLDLAMRALGSRMQRAEELVGVKRTMELLAPFAQIDPSVLDVFDRDARARLTAEVSGVPTPVLRSQEAVDAIRQQRAQQEQDAAMVAAAQPIAGAMKDAAQANQLLQGP